MTLLHQAAQKAVEALEREAFEAWARGPAGYVDDQLARYADGSYQDSTTLVHWSIWRAACKASRGVVAALQQQPEPVASSAHMCGMQGFDGMLDICPACEARRTPPALQHQEVPREPVAHNPLPAETAQPMFASHVGRRKWEQLQGDGYRMQRIHFARSVDGHERRGTIDPWGKVLWEADGIAPPALQHQEVPPPECKTEEEKRAFAFGWWKAMEANRASCTGAYAFGVQEVPREPVADLLRGLVNHWNEFGPEHGLDEMMDAAHRYLAASPSTTRQQEVGSFDKTGERINALAKEAGFHMEPMTNMLYTVRGNHAQLVNFARLVLAAAPSTPEKAGGVSDGVARTEGGA